MTRWPRLQGLPEYRHVDICLNKKAFSVPLERWWVHDASSMEFAMEPVKWRVVAKCPVLRRYAKKTSRHPFACIVTVLFFSHFFQKLRRVRRVA